jgi:type VI protein secretion system component VasK
VTSRNLLPGYGRSAGPIALLAAVAVVVITGAALAVRADAAAGAVAVLGLVLSGVAVVGICLVLIVARSSGRAARAHALRQLGAARRAEAVAADLRDEVVRLQSDLARLAARIETSHRRPGR